MEPCFTVFFELNKIVICSMPSPVRGTTEPFLNFLIFFNSFFIQFNSLVCTFQWSFTLVGITEACGLSVIMITIFLYTLKHIDLHSSTSEFLSHSYIVHIHFHDYSYIYFLKHIYIYVTNLTLVIISCNTSKYIII